MLCGKSKFHSSFSALKLIFYCASVTLLLLVLFMQNETILDDIEINGYHDNHNVRNQLYANSSRTSIYLPVSKYFWVISSTISNFKLKLCSTMNILMKLFSFRCRPMVQIRTLISKVISFLCSRSQTAI